MTHVKIRNGQLFEDGKRVRPEFGNLAHIKAIKDAESALGEHELTCKCGKVYQLWADEDGYVDYQQVAG